MRVSIITVVYNNQEFIGDAIKSVLSQTHKNIEYIVIDGGSIDGTTEIIKSYGNKIATFISEPDKGIYDAINKGIILASGEIVGILNSDDFYANDSIVETIVKAMSEKKVDACYGDLVYTNNDSKVVRYWKSCEYRNGLFQQGWAPPHPTFFVKKLVYEKYGMFNTDFKISADYEIMLRFLYKYEISTAYINKTLVKMRRGGISNKSIKNIIKANIECYSAWKINKFKINKCVFFLKPLSKLRQVRLCE